MVDGEKDPPDAVAGEMEDDALEDRATGDANHRLGYRVSERVQPHATPAGHDHRPIRAFGASNQLTQYVQPEQHSHTPERILAAVSERFGVRPETLAGKRRTQTITVPRQVAMYLMRHLTELSLVEIGRVFGGRDHSTVIHACKQVAERLQSDDSFRDKVNGLFSTVSS